jgi:pSer/pThr/pTyr-binding forkhead associated (FHA) protein
VGLTIVLFIVTLGIYGIYWLYKSFAEIRGYRGQGVGGLAGVLLAFIAVSTFLLPSYVGRMHQEAGEHPPITGWGGFWVFVPFIGSFIWLAKIQGALNRFWAAREAGAAGMPAMAAGAAAAAPAIAAPQAAPPAAAPPPQQAVPPPVAPPPAQPQYQPPQPQYEPPQPQYPQAAPPPQPPPAPAVPPPVGGETRIAGAAAPVGNPTLLFTQGMLAGRRFEVESELTLGRENTDVVVEDPEVSRRHASLRWSAGRLELSDLQSANGTYVNGERVSGVRELHSGDAVKIGATSLVVEVPQPPPRDPGATVLRPS